MSDPEVPQPERPKDVDDVVDSANEGLDAAAAAGAGVPGASADESRVRPAVDPDVAAFEAAENDHPGTFSTPELNDPRYLDPEPDVKTDASTADDTAAYVPPVAPERSSLAGDAYSSNSDTATRVVPAEPSPSDRLRSESAAAETAVVEPAVVPVQQQPIFVQAPEAPRERGNRGTAGAIGLLATVAFAVLYLAATLGLGAVAGDVTAANIGDAALAPLTTWGFWVPVVVFFLGFWLLGAFINRGRWGLWVVFGIIVGVIAYGGHILGALLGAPFWQLTATEGNELVSSQLFHPLAIAAFVFARELTIWFGAWVARSGARKTELNAEAQREYERTLEAGPTLSR
ncbi:ABC transporter [Microbacterium sp. NPDC097977]|uniref:ABC transporter n=1 Tax=Microbacterium sp. NPDC097977 TaxID=3155686 RepID=UPI00331BB38D